MRTFTKIVLLMALGLSLTTLNAAENGNETLIKEMFTCSVALADKKELESNIVSGSFTKSQNKSFKSALKTTNRAIALHKCKLEVK